MTLVCVVLAGGRSLRMGGGHKCLISVNGTPMLARVLQAVTPQVQAVLINSNGDPKLFEEFHLPVLADCLPGHHGPLAGLLTGMRWAKRHASFATHLLSVPCDCPRLPPDLVEQLNGPIADGCEIAVARDAERVHPTIGIWPVSLAERLTSDLVGHGVRAMHTWLRRFTVQEVRFDARDLSNINTPEDLVAFE